MTLFQEGIKEQGSTKQDLLEDAELELKILDIIKSYCNGYKEPVLLNIVHPKKIIEVISASKVYSKLDKIRKRNLILSMKKEIYIKAKTNFIDDNRGLIKPLKINGISNLSFDKIKELSSDMNVELFNIYNINFDHIQKEIDQIIEEFLKKWILKQKQYEKEYQEREADRQASGYYQQKQEQYQEYQQRYKQSQQFENAGMTQEQALTELELPLNTNDFSIIQKSFYRLAKKHHPDKYSNDHKKEKEANEKFKKLVEAYEFLKSLFGKK